MNTYIKTNDISKEYKNFKALKRVNLTLDNGDIYGLVGKNGAGKTTLFKIIMGLAKASSGSYEVLGESNQQIAYNNVGFMMDTNFYGYLNAQQNLEYCRRIKGISNKSEVKRVLHLVGLADEKKPVKQYSMGMKQRLGIANALLGSPCIVILDEPLNGLDPQGIYDLRKIIVDLNEKEGITFIISSHILGELGLMATKFGFIDHGHLIEEISKEELVKKTSNGLLLKIDDPKRASFILENELGIFNYKVRSNDEIIIYEKINDSNEIMKVFINAKINVYKMQVLESTLEDYFLKLVGGN